MTSACFQICGALPDLRDKLKRSERGRARGWASSLRSRLFITSGPAALPIGSDFKLSLTSSGVIMIESSLYVVFPTFKAGLLGFHQTECVK